MKELPLLKNLIKGLIASLVATFIVFSFCKQGTTGFMAVWIIISTVIWAVVKADRIDEKYVREMREESSRALHAIFALRVSNDIYALLRTAGDPKKVSLKQESNGHFKFREGNRVIEILETGVAYYHERADAETPETS